MHNLGVLFAATSALTCFCHSIVLVIRAHLALITTGSTFSPRASTSFPLHHNIVTRQGMATTARVRHVSNHVWMCPTIQVDGMRRRLKVVRTNAPPVPTQVIQWLTRRNRPNQLLVSISMGTVVLPLSEHSSVPKRRGPLPHPAWSVISAILNDVVNTFSEFVSRHRLILSRHSNYTTLCRPNTLPNKWVPWTWIDERALKAKAR